MDMFAQLFGVFFKLKVTILPPFDFDLKAAKSYISLTAQL